MNSNKNLVILALSLIISVNVQGQILKNANKFLKQGTGSLSEKDAAEGIREALINGTGEAVKVVSNVDGYFKSPEIKIPFPPEAKEIETKLRAIGLGKKVDEVVLAINRAAEDASKEAVPIFVTAIKNMTVKDAVNIVKGENDAATGYLKQSSTPELKTKFQPVIKNSLDKVQATKYWEDLIKTYNKIPMVKKMNPDLTSYVTDKAIDGLFIMVAKEEFKIRKDPKARTTELLRKVFGS
ncbi:MAG: DUF4197 domain-containing protein [Bacteroidetes bacterium]|nr:DUF4197 domain-containing protein [Bacteroidota bacterium]